VSPPKSDLLTLAQLSKSRQLESDVQAQNEVLLDRQGAVNAKVAELSERELRLTAALEEEKARGAAVSRELAGERCSGAGRGGWKSSTSALQRRAAGYAQIENPPPP
jgi:hypothetical protein